MDDFSATPPPGSPQLTGSLANMPDYDTPHIRFSDEETNPRGDSLESGWLWLEAHDDDLASLIRARLPTIDHMLPKKAEAAVLHAWATTLAYYHQHKATSPTAALRGVAAFLIFPSLVLPKGKAGRRKRHQAIVARCNKWMDGQWADLFEEAEAMVEAGRAASAERRSNHNARLQDDDHTLHAAREAADAFDSAERRARARLAKGELAFAAKEMEQWADGDTKKAPLTEAQLGKLKAMFPERSTDHISQEVLDFVPEERITCELQLVKKLIRGLKRGKAPGASQMRTEHLKVWLESEECMASLLVPFLLDIANGEVSDEIAALLGDSDMVALPKASGSGLRPIALLELIRNVAGNIAMKASTDTLREALFPLQMAVAVKGGIETVIHAVRGILSKMPEWVLLQIDFENMFNEISRDGVLKAVMRHCPQALPFVRVFYARRAWVSLKASEVIDNFCICEQGVFQGDVWGSAAACCLLLDFQLELKQHLKDKGHEAVQLGIADDVQILGHHDAVACAYDFIAEAAPSKASGATAPEPYALKGRPDKFKLYSPAGRAHLDAVLPASRIPADVERLYNGVRCVGAPVGDDEFCKKFSKDLVTKTFKKRLDGIASMKDTQAAMLLLRYCCITRFSFTLRTLPPHLVSEAAEEMDLNTRAALDKILDVDGNADLHLDDDDWANAQLAIKDGGLGLWSAARTAPAAFAGSIALCLKDLCKMEASWPAELKGVFTDICSGETDYQRILTDALEAARKEVKSGVEARRGLERFHKPPAGVGVEPRTEEDIAKDDEKPEKTVPLVEALMEHQHTFVQKKVSELREKRTQLDVLEGSSRKRRARIMSASTTGAGAFLTCIPTRGDLQLNRRQMMVALRFRLGLPQPAAMALCGKTCACGTRLSEEDIDGGHLIDCKHAGGAGWGRRSKFVQLKTKEIAIDAGLNATLEQVVGSERDRTDVTVHDWIVRDDKGVVQTWDDGSAKTTVMHTDVAVVNATANSYVNRSAKLRGSAAHARGARKIKKYQSQVAPDLFVPAIVEAHGLLDHGFVKLLSNIAESHIDLSRPGADLSMTERSVIKSQLMNKSYQLISVALQKGLETNLTVAVKRATVEHARRTGVGAGQRGLSTCQMQEMMGAHDRAVAFGSQVVA